MNLFLIFRSQRHFIQLLTVSICIAFLSSCATSKLQKSNDSGSITPPNRDSLSVVHTFYLIGDAGNAEKDSTTLALKALSSNLKLADKNATVLFLGDNIYPKGLPKKDDSDRSIAEHKLNAQIDAVSGFKGKTIFIPGNHDWYSEGVKGLKRQQEFIEEKLGKKSFLPKNGCPLESVNIGDDIVLIIVDSEWYITNWDHHPTINADCEIKTTTQFLDELRNEIKKARGKTTLIAIHHPMFSNGPHGGQYDLKSHMTPIPIVGSLVNLFRKNSGIINADLQNWKYNELRKNLIAAAKQNDKVILVSGHEHSLQYIIENKIPQIISGSGSKSTPCRNVGGGKYCHETPGYAVLEVFNDGSSFVKFIEAKNNKVEFQTSVVKPDLKKATFEFASQFPNTMQASVYDKGKSEKSRFHKFLWGQRYRKYYFQSITAQTVDLDTLFGGVKPIRKGGGHQSMSLRLKTKDGQQYVMRAVKKNALQFIQASLFKDQYVQDQFKDSAPESLIQDVFTGSHPYAPFVVSTLSDAIGLAHLNPKLYYIPKQKALGEFNSEFGNELYAVEELPNEGHLAIGGANFSGKYLATNEVLLELRNNPAAKVDERQFIKARLFDMLIGDWDRHPDQWRWMEYKENGKSIYRPLPRDRDQAFSVMSDGFLLGAAVELIEPSKMLRKYGPDLKDVRGFNVSPYPIDKAIIQESLKSVWDEEVKSIQNGITDAIIDEAFNNLPEEVKDETITKIKTFLKERRKNLGLIAGRYYKLLSKFETVTASDKDDIIRISKIANRKMDITILTKSKDGNLVPFLHKVVDPSLTKEIWVYGLDGEDRFEVSGTSGKVKVRLVGGQNEDEFIVENGKNILIYDYRSKKNNISKAGSARVRLDNDYETNVYDFKKLKASTEVILPAIGSNPDDGLKLGVNATFTKYGFLRNPFTAQNQLKAAYFFATQGYELSYRGEFAKVLRNFNLEIKAQMQSPNFSQNFWGFGNETQNFDDDLSLDFNRVKIEAFRFFSALKWYSNRSTNVSLGCGYERLQVDRTANRFVTSNSKLPSNIFDQFHFFGIESVFEFENYDNKAFATNGMSATLKVGYKSNIDLVKRNFGYIIPEVSFDNKIDNAGKLVLATKIKSHVIWGNNFEFFQGASIGGFDGLRGFRNQRFVGNYSLYQNTDLRYCFNTAQSKTIPIRYGLYGGFDYGRIWLKGEDSKKWHNSYGGGFFINGAELLNANLGVFSSTDGIRVAFGLGFDF